MKNTNIADGDSFTDEVEVDLDMFRTLMLNGVRGQVYSTDIVAVNESAPS